MPLAHHSVHRVPALSEAEIPIQAQEVVRPASDFSISFFTLILGNCLIWWEKQSRSAESLVAYMLSQKSQQASCLHSWCWLSQTPSTGARDTPCWQLKAPQPGHCLHQTGVSKDIPEVESQKGYKFSSFGNLQILIKSKQLCHAARFWFMLR